MSTITFTATGNYEANGDTDWFKFHMTAGTTYNVSGGVPGGGQVAQLQLYDADGHLITIPYAFSNQFSFVASTTGDYFVSAHALGNPIGGYSIQIGAVQAAIPGSINTPVNLTVGTTRTVSQSDDQMSGAEWFGVDLVAGQSYVLASTGTFQKTYIADANGKLLFTDNGGETHFTATQTGHYFAAVAQGQGSGYDVRISAVADDHSDSIGNAGTLTLGTAAAGIWEAGGDSDWYAVTLQAGSSYNLAVSSTEGPNGGAFVEVADATGKILYSGTNTGSGSTSSTIFSPTTTGTYYVSAGTAARSSSTDLLADGANTQAWHYTVSASVMANEVTDNTLTTGHLTVGLGVSGSWEKANDSDWYAVTLTQGQSYLFSRENSSASDSVTLGLYDSTGHLVISSLFNGGVSLHHTAETSGTYYLAAIAGNQPGNYAITADVVSDDFADNAATTGRLTVNGAAATGNFEAGSDRDWFAVDLVANQSYLIGGSAFTVRDAAGHALTDINWGDPTFTPSVSGTYYVEADGPFGPGSGPFGSYSVTIKTQADDFAESVATTGQVRLTFTGDASDDVFDAANYPGNPATLNGNDGNDTLAGSDLADTINGGAGNDILYGRGGNDSISGGTGADAMVGGTGNDLYSVDNAGDVVYENAGEGTDRVSASVSYYLYANIENLSLGGTAVFGVGNDLANSLTGNTGDNLLLGGLGDDVVHGAAGNDQLYGEDGADQLFGDAGVDYLIGGAGADMLDGGADADALYGEGGDDVLWGGTDLKTDLFFGGDGNDILHGDSGLGDYDLMDGGAGNDSYYVDTGADQIFEAADGGTDTVYANVGDGQGVYLYANVENLVLQGTSFFGVGNELANNLTGNASANWLLGGAGNDILNGKDGNDVLFGQDGADTFVFEHGTGGDTIADFTAGTDHIDLSAFGFTSFAQVQAAMSETGGSTAIVLGNGDFIVLQNVGNAALHSGDFVLSGGSSGGAQVQQLVHADPVDDAGFTATRGALIHQFDTPGLYVAAGDILAQGQF